MLKKFKTIDEKQTGVVTIHQLRKAMSNCAMLTPKEQNIIMRSFKQEQTHFEYKTFEHLLFDVRFELARSRLMDSSLDKLSELLIAEFSKFDVDSSGLITITEVKKALFNSKHTNLTPFQVYTLIGTSSPDAMGRVNYREFAARCKGLIDELFSMKSISDKAELIASKQYSAPEGMDELKLTHLELFELFKRYDRNMNGFLEIHEYIQCLKDS